MRFFNELVELGKTRNRLPHWQQEGATYFVTWRLKDSIPRVLFDEWRKERSEWMADHPLPWTAETEADFHRIFSTRIDTMMDGGHGECSLKRKDCREVVAESLAKFDGDRYMMHSWVVMPNHVHVLFTTAEDRKLEDTLGGWKGYTAKVMNKLLGRSGVVWQKDYFDRMIRDWEHMFRVARYIRRNPVKAKLREGEYEVWEAGWVGRMLGDLALGSGSVRLNCGLGFWPGLPGSGDAAPPQGFGFASRR